MDLQGIAGRLREERDRLGLNQDQFAALADTGRMTVYRYEQGSHLPTLGFLSLVGAAGVDVDYVLTGKRSVVSLGFEQAELVDRAVAVVEDLIDKHRFEPSPEMRGRLILQAMRVALAGGSIRKSPSLESLITESHR